MSNSPARAARDIIGPEANDDYILQPEEHAKKLPQEAGALRRVLESAKVVEIMRQYREADSAAITYQSRYKFFARAAIASQCLGGLIGALFIAPQFFGIGNTELETSLNVVQLVLIGAAAIAGIVVSARSYFKKWNDARARAEVARIRFFTDVTTTTDAGSQIGEAPLLPLQWEYFRRYQFDIQRTYYKRRGQKHREMAKRFKYLSRALALVLFVLFINSISRVAGYVIIEIPTPLSLFIGVAVATLSSARSNWSLLNQDENNAIRYEATSAKLEDIHTTYSKAAETGAEGGDRDGVLSLVNYINGYISLEHRQWIYLHEVARQPELGSIGTFTLPKFR